MMTPEQRAELEAMPEWQQHLTLAFLAAANLCALAEDQDDAQAGELHINLCRGIAGTVLHLKADKAQIDYVANFVGRFYGLPGQTEALAPAHGRLQ